MPTSSHAFAVVAHALGNVDPEDGMAVDGFYENVFPAYSEAARELVADFLISQTAVPSTDDLAALREAVNALYDKSPAGYLAAQQSIMELQPAVDKVVSHLSTAKESTALHMEPVSSSRAAAAAR